MQTKLKKITDNILYLPADDNTDRPILAAICGDKKTLLIDSGNSSNHARLFLEELKRNNVKSPDYVVITHWHWDHIFGIQEMSLPTIASKETGEKIKEMKDYVWTEEALDKRVAEKIEIPFCAEMMKKEFENIEDIRIVTLDITFNNRLFIDLGGENCIIEKVGGDHSPGSTIIYVERQKVLFLGDCLAPDIYCEPWKYNPDNFSGLIGKIEQFQAEVYIESHWKPVDRKEFWSETDYMKMISYLVKKQKGNIDKIKTNLESSLERDLNQDDYELIQYFINGYE